MKNPRRLAYPLVRWLLQGASLLLLLRTRLEWWITRPEVEHIEPIPPPRKPTFDERMEAIETRPLIPFK